MTSETSSYSDITSPSEGPLCALCYDALATVEINNIYVCETCNVSSAQRQRANYDHPDCAHLPFLTFQGDGILAGATFQPLDDYDQSSTTKNLANIEAAEAIYNKPAHFKFTAIDLSSDNALTTILESANQQLSLLSEWTRWLQYFSSDGLSEENRSYLLNVGWLRLLLLNLAMHSADYGSEIVLANGTILTPSSDSETVPDTLRIEIRKHLIEPFRSLNLDCTERGLLRVILLFNTSLPTTPASAILTQVRNRVHCDLKGYRKKIHRDWFRCRMTVMPLVKLMEIAKKCLDFLKNVDWHVHRESVPLLAHLVERGVWPQSNGLTVPPLLTDRHQEPSSDQTR